MGPVIKTYGGYKPKRRGLPKFVKETLETTGNAFSALHIDNLKAIRGGDNLKPKNCKVTKITTVREVQPTFDDSLDSTFDKILKCDKKEQSDKASLPFDSNKMFELDSANQCWTCGCIPAINMAHHVLFECKEDSYYSSPSPSTKKAVARKVKQVADKEKRRKKLKLQKSSAKKSLKKESPLKKEKTMRKLQFEGARGPILPLKVDIVAPKSLLNGNAFISPVKSPFKTPLYKGSWLSEKSSTFITSTPDGCDRRPKFSIQTSPIFVALPRDNIDIKDLPVQLVEDVQSNSQELVVKDMCKVSSKSQEVTNKLLDKKELEVWRQPEVFANNVLDEQNPLEEIGRVPPLFTDNEQTEKHSAITPNTLTNGSVDLIETSVVQPLHRPSGYITKRRMWRRTRRTDFNLSIDMFKSITKSTFDDHPSRVDASSVIDRLKVSTSRNDKSFLCRKEQSNTQQRFSISLDVKEDVGVKLIKSESNIEKSYAFEISMECANNSSIMEISERTDSEAVKHSNFDLSIHELSKELKVSLTLLSPKDKIRVSAYSNCDSDVDMFSELSIQHSKFHLQSPKSNVPDLLEEQMFASPASKTNHPVMDESVVKSLSADESLRENPISGMESMREVALRHDESSNVGESSDVKSFCSDRSVAIRSLDVDESLRQCSLSVDDIFQDSDVSFEVVLKPCYVKLRRCDSQTMADVLYTSHCDMSVTKDDDEAEVMDHQEKLNESDHTSFNAQNHNSLNTVVELPLSLLGKLDKITIRGSSKTSQSSFESVIRNGRLLEQSVMKLAEIQTEDNEAAKERHEINTVNKNTSGDFSEVLSRCGQTEPLPFITSYPKSMLPKCKKIGEGAYGEVFLYDAEKQKTVIKIIPIEGDLEINAAVQKKFWEIKPEIIVAQELSALRKFKTGRNSCDIFNEVLAVRCVRGKYPQWMLDLWHAFDEEKGSENDCPDVFGDDQLFIVLELAHGGQDLESYEFTSAEQAVACITQIAFALAVGESEIQFEHRDLHWGNVLVASTKAKTVQFTLGGEKYKVTTKGVKASVIDFTMSRMTMPANGENMFYDFGHDEELFAAQGDYQCDIYRLMRERTRNNWAVYEPFTNILWLHYLLDKMCSMVAYRNQTTKVHQQFMTKLENMRDTVLAYSSATAFSSEFFKSSKVR